MSLWTPGGEHPVDRGRDQPSPRPPADRDEAPPAQGPPGGAPDFDDLSPEEQEQVRAMQAQLAEARERILSAPASDVVANHAMGLYELAAIHLTAEEPRLGEAVLAIDALAALLDGLRGRLGDAEPTLVDALGQLRAAYLERRG